MIKYLSLCKESIEGFKYVDDLTKQLSSELTAIYVSKASSVDIQYSDKVLIVSLGKEYEIKSPTASLPWRMVITKEMTPYATQLIKVFYKTTYKLDISNRSLHFEAEQFKNFFDTIPANMYIKDAKSRFLRVNKRWRDYIGLESSFDIIGKTDFDIFDHRHAQQAFDDEQEIITTGQAKIAYEEKEIFPDGKEAWLLSTKVPVRDVNGTIIGTSGISYDISNLKKVEKDLKDALSQLSKSNNKLTKALAKAQKSKELEKKNKELLEHKLKLQEAHDTIHQKKMLLELLNQELTERNNETRQLNDELKENNSTLSGQNDVMAQTLEELKNTQSQLVQSEKMASVGILASGLAHEINNPLNFISGSLKAIEDYLDQTAPDHKSRLNKILTAANTGIDRATKIVKSLNRFNRKSDRMDEECDMKLVIENCLIMLEDRMKNKVKVHTKFCDEQNIILGNEGELHQVLLNLLVNAEQSIDGEGTIRITTTIDNGYLKIKVIDDGKGIKKEDISKITNPFFTTKKPGEGTGLGMSIAYSIIKKHNGKIDYKSSVGQGTTVSLSFPIHLSS